MAPSWAASVLMNYRNMFKAKYGRDTTLGDDAIFQIVNSVFDDTSTQLEDDARVETMLEKENG